MNTIHLAIDTDENGNIWTYHFSTREEAEDFIKRANASYELDVHFEYVPVNGVITADQALADIFDMKGVDSHE